MAKDKFERRPLPYGANDIALNTVQLTPAITTVMARIPGDGVHIRSNYNIEDNGMDQAVTASLHALTGQSATIINIGAHARTLNELKHDEPVPEKFQCSIISEIMTDPVYDPSHPQYKFERAVIEEILRRKAENPYTRTPLMISELVSDAILKQEIDQYIATIVSKNSPKPM
jgi:hypothetical protein